MSCTPIPDVPQTFRGDNAANEDETEEMDDLHEASGECQPPLPSSFAEGVEAADAEPGERGVCVHTARKGRERHACMQARARAEM